MLSSVRFYCISLKLLVSVSVVILQENVDLIRKEIEQMVDKRKSMNIAKALKASPQLVKKKRDEVRPQLIPVLVRERVCGENVRKCVCSRTLVYCL